MRVTNAITRRERANERARERASEMANAMAMYGVRSTGRMDDDDARARVRSLRDGAARRDRAFANARASDKTRTRPGDMIATVTSSNMTQRHAMSGRAVAPNARAASRARAHARGALVVRGAATKERKNEQLQALAKMVNAEETFLVAGFNYQSLSVRCDARERGKESAEEGV